MKTVYLQNAARRGAHTWFAGSHHVDDETADYLVSQGGTLAEAAPGDAPAIEPASGEAPAEAAPEFDVQAIKRQALKEKEERAAAKAAAKAAHTAPATAPAASGETTAPAAKATKGAKTNGGAS